MKRAFFLLLCCLVLSLSACGVPQTDYDALVEENSSLQAQVESLKSENQSIQEEYLNYKNEQILAKMDDSYGIAWATTSFGDDTICFTSEDGSHFQCHASNTYEISETGIATLWSDFLNSVATLGLISENMNYETISIKFYDPSGIYIMDIVIRNESNKYNLDTISCNYIYTVEILDTLMTLTAK